METKIVGLASDHAAFPLKEFVKQYLEEKGIPYKDYGTHSEESCNYATFGHLLAEGVENGEVYPGIAMCGSGEGISMTLNKHQGVRAGLCWMPEIAHLIRQHNDANVLCIGGKIIGSVIAMRIVEVWMSTDPLTAEKYVRRREKVAAIDEECTVQK